MRAVSFVRLTNALEAPLVDTDGPTHTIWS